MIHLYELDTSGSGFHLPSHYASSKNNNHDSSSAFYTTYLEQETHLSVRKVKQ
jgi:hypothetical protein